MMPDDPEETLAVREALAGELVRLVRPPKEVLADAAEAAKALKDVIDNKKRKVMFNGEQYLEFEDWQTCARFYGITAKIVNVDFVQYGTVKGFTARAVALRSDGMEISGAEAECLDDEEKWRSRPKYEWRDTPQGREKHQIGDEAVPLFQLKSMAQTRACAKVLRNVLAWVVVLAGYRATPSEELDAEVVKSERVPAGTETHAPAQPAQPVSAHRRFLPVLYVTDVAKKSGDKAGKAWVNFTVTLSDRRSGSTFDGALATKAQFFCTNRTPVDPVATTFEQKGKYVNLLTLEAAAKVVVSEAPHTGAPPPPWAGAPKETTGVFTVLTVGHGTLSPDDQTVFYEIRTQELDGAVIRTLERDLAKLAFDAKQNSERLELTYKPTDRPHVFQLVKVGAIVRAPNAEAQTVADFVP